MADPLENACEQFAVALLSVSSALTAIIPAEDIVREAEDTDASKNRIICKASKREIEATGRTQSEILVWRVPVVEAAFQAHAAELYAGLAKLEEHLLVCGNQ